MTAFCKAYTLLRDENHRADVAEICTAWGFKNESDLYRYVVRREVLALREAKEREAAELRADDLRGEAEDAQDFGGDPSPVRPHPFEPGFPGPATYDDGEATYSPPNVSPTDQPSAPGVLFEPDDFEDHEEEEEAADDDFLSDLEDLAADLYIDRASEDEAAAFLARFMPALLAYCDAPTIEADRAALVARHADPVMVPKLVISSLRRRLAALQTARE